MNIAKLELKFEISVRFAHNLNKDFSEIRALGTHFEQFEGSNTKLSHFLHLHRMPQHRLHRMTPYFTTFCHLL